MKNVFDKTETSISNTKRKKKMLRKDVDRLLEDVICADIHNVVLLHAFPFASDSISADIVDTVVTVDNSDLVHQFKSLKAENER